MDKKKFKYIQNKCKLCSEDDKGLLDVHRIIPGKDGGKYTKLNSVTVCANCHRRIHGGEIEVLGYVSSSVGLLLEIKRNTKLDYV